MELDWLKDFIALTEHQTFSRAAEARHVTQPAFSRRIRALETWIGTALFERNANGAALTPAGDAFQPLARELLRGLDRARREVLAAAERETSTLAIAATHALSFTFFPGWITQPGALDLQGPVSLVSNTLDACEQALLSGEVHFLLCHTRDGMDLQLDPARYPRACVGRDELIAVCTCGPDGQPLWPIPGVSSRPARILGYSAASGLGRILARALPDASLATPETVFTSHLAATLLAMAREGRGAAWLPRSLVAEDLASGRLVTAGGVPVDVEICLFRSPDCRNRAADALWEWASRSA